MILLTGASGFIGKHLLTSLAEKYGIDEVIAFTSSPIAGYNYLLHNNYQFDDDYFVQTDFGHRIDTIIHAGSYTPKNAAEANDWRRCTQNIYNTQKLLEARLPNLKKFIYLSTLDVYGENDIISEASLIEPVSQYGYSKLYSERLIATWACQQNIASQILRLGHVYGPGEEAYQKIIPATISKIKNDQPIQIWGTGLELRSFIYIKDVVLAILNCLNLTENVGPVNIVGGTQITISKLVNKLIAISGKTLDIEFVNTTGKSRNLVFDNNKLKQYLLPLETDLDVGLSEEWLYMKGME